MKNFFRYLFFLFYAGALAAGMGLSVYPGRERGERARLEEIKTALSAVAPSYENEPWRESFDFLGRKVFPCWQQVIEEEGPAAPDAGVSEEISPPQSPRIFYRKDLSGFAWTVRGAGIFRGLEMAVGFDTRGRLTGCKVLGGAGAHGREIRFPDAERILKKEADFFSGNAAALMGRAQEAVGPLRIEKVTGAESP